MMESTLLKLQHAWRHAFSEWHFHRTEWHEEEEKFRRFEYVSYKAQLRYEHKMISGEEPELDPCRDDSSPALTRFETRFM